MTPQESLLGPAGPIFNYFLDSLAGSNDSSIAGLAVRSRERVMEGRKRDISIIPNRKPFSIPTITSFELLDMSVGNLPLFTPVLVVDADRMMMASSPATMQTDLVRTLAVMDQFPENGYERRLRQVYGDAIDIERRWLESQQTKGVDFDPRQMDREELLQKLLGDVFYYTDVGFPDFQGAVDHLLMDEVVGERVELLKSVREDKRHFISGRKKFVPLAHSSALMAGQDRYIHDISEDDRAKAVALLIAATIYTRPKST